MSVLSIVDLRDLVAGSSRDLAPLIVRPDSRTDGGPFEDRKPLFEDLGDPPVVAIARVGLFEVALALFQAIVSFFGSVLIHFSHSH